MASFGSMRAVEREFRAADRALGRFLAEWHLLDPVDRQDIAFADAQACRSSLEGTFVLRTLATFEEILRRVLVEEGVAVSDGAGFREKCQRVGRRFRIDDALRQSTESMADARNELAHGRTLVPTEALEVVAARCRRFLAACG